jgi:zinc/manganese transport system substrate-binding protein
MRTIPIPTGRIARVAVCALVAATLACGVAACGGPPSAGSPGVVQVVAAENFWGSIAAQLGGRHAHVTSIVANPDTDPHAYEPTPQDARAMAVARYVVVNGAGYDPWAPKLVDADPVSDRVTLSVADLAGRRDGDNPHMWYSPGIVLKVAQRISADLSTLDPADAAYFAEQSTAFTTQALRRYDELRTAIKTAYHGTPVGATESIFEDLAADLDLDLVTPPAFMRAVSEGDDPRSQDKATVDAQITGRRIKVLVVNSQNSTPDIQALVDKAHARSIPVVSITETLVPAGSSFQDWQASQLAALQQALAASSA